jgi:hypothetical protein
MGGISIPYDSGQSGTASPEPVLVTSPPMKIRTRVAAAVATASRCRPGWSPAGSPPSRLLARAAS